MPAVMTKPRTRSATTIARELRARLDADEDNEHAVLKAQVEFWDKFRPILAANDASVGLEALDALALSVLADDDELPPVLDRTVVIVPHPDAAVRGEVPAHPLFSFVASPYHGKRPSARGSSKAAGPAKKKQRQLRRAPSILENLPAHVSAKLRVDLEKLEQAAAELGTVVVRLASDSDSEPELEDDDELELEYATEPTEVETGEASATPVTPSSVDVFGLDSELFLAEQQEVT
ncbi:hypothetical protein PR001_g25448, partial [Phytophthora rubi]